MTSGTQSPLVRAIALAAEAHAHQTDLSGAPYILHPLRVMLAVRGEMAQCAAVMHDVIEDSAQWTIELLREEGFSQLVNEAVDVLTKRKDEPYTDYIISVYVNPIARAVKIADLEDNMDVLRMRRTGLATKDMDRLNRYLWAWNLLTQQSSGLEQPPAFVEADDHLPQAPGRTQSGTNRHHE